MIRVAIALLAVLTVPSVGLAQELPQPSLHARVEQTVGVTNIAVDYSSPAVRGRVILGKLVPFGEYWRAGANAATTVTFENDVTVLGKSVPAGTYRFGAIPTKAGWTAVFSKEGGNPVDLDEKKVVAKARVKSKVRPSRERLAYSFENTTNDRTNLVLAWSTFEVIVPIEVDTGALVTQNLDAAVRESWRTLMRTGRYLKDEGQHERALEHLDKSLAVKETWWATWYKAETLAAMGKKKEAISTAKSARSLAEGDDVFDRFFKEDVEKALAAWAE